MNLEFRHKVREKSGNFELGQGIWNLHIKPGNLDIYPNIYSTYGYGSLLKIVKKDHLNHQSTSTPRVYYATNMCYVIYSTRVCGIVGRSVMSRSTQYYTILRFIILFGIIFSETYIQHCQNILHHQKNVPH